MRRDTGKIISDVEKFMRTKYDNAMEKMERNRNKQFVYLRIEDERGMYRGSTNIYTSEKELKEKTGQSKKIDEKEFEYEKEGKKYKIYKLPKSAFNKFIKKEAPKEIEQTEEQKKASNKKKTNKSDKSKSQKESKKKENIIEDDEDEKPLSKLKTKTKKTDKEVHKLLKEKLGDLYDKEKIDKIRREMESMNTHFEMLRDEKPVFEESLIDEWKKELKSLTGEEQQKKEDEKEKEKEKPKDIPKVADAPKPAKKSESNVKEFFSKKSSAELETERLNNYRDFKARQTNKEIAEKLKLEEFIEEMVKQNIYKNSPNTSALNTLLEISRDHEDTKEAIRDWLEEIDGKSSKGKIEMAGMFWLKKLQPYLQKK